QPAAERDDREVRADAERSEGGVPDRHGPAQERVRRRDPAARPGEREVPGAAGPVLRVPARDPGAAVAGAPARRRAELRGPAGRDETGGREDPERPGLNALG